MISLLIAIIYLCFVSLGLPDSLLGSAWPTIYLEYNIPISYQGIISITISACTIISSLFSDFLTKKLKPFIVIVLSIFLTSFGLFGFSISNKFYMLILFSIPYGLGAGSIDACLNNYVALNFKSKHMIWLHAMWGLGASISPYIMGYAISKLGNWHKGYLIVSIIQGVITFIVLLSFPLWKKNRKEKDSKEELNIKPITIKEIINTKGAIVCFLMFFAYCAFESTSFLWASSYLNLGLGVDKALSANLAFLLYFGITLGRIVSGFVSERLGDNKLINIGSIIIGIGLILLFIPINITTYIGLFILGFGFGPIYPSIIHMTPNIFSKEKSQAMIGFQMAFAYTGSAFMPPLFGIIANHINIKLYPVWILLFFILMLLMHYILDRKVNLHKKELIR